MQRFIGLLLGGLLCCVGVQAKVLTLQEAILISLRHNPSVINANFQRTLDKFDLRVSENKFEWQYELTGNATRSVTDTRTSDNKSISRSYELSPSMSIKSAIGTKVTLAMPQNYSANGDDSSTYTTSASITVTQPLIKGAGADVVLADLQDAYADNEVSKLTLRDTIINHISKVIDAYYDLVQKENALITQQAALDSAKNTLEKYRAQIKAGEMAPNNVVNQELQVANSELTITEGKNAIYDAKQNLFKVIGSVRELNAQDLQVVSKPDIDSLQVPNLEKSVEIALRNNIDFLKKKIELKKSERSLLRAKNNALWDLNLSASAGFGGSGPGIGGITRGHDKTRSIGLSLSVPIRNFSNERSIMAAKNTLRNQRLTLAQAERDLRLDVRDAINDLTNLVALIKQTDRSTELAEQNFEIEQKKQAFGLSTTLDVTNQQTKLVDAKIGQIAKRIEYLKKRNQFWKLLGITLDEWDIKVRY